MVYLYKALFGFLDVDICRYVSFVTHGRTRLSLACAPVPEVSGLCNILKFLVQQLSTKRGKFMHTYANRMYNYDLICK